MLITLHSHHINSATQYYITKPDSDPHLARLYFQQSQIPTLTVGPGATSFLHRAFAIRAAMRPDDVRSAEELTEKDFDELVGMWER